MVHKIFETTMVGVEKKERKRERERERPREKKRKKDTKRKEKTLKLQMEKQKSRKKHLDIVPLSTFQIIRFDFLFQFTFILCEG
jgi:hypothetical protein